MCRFDHDFDDDFRRRRFDCRHNHIRRLLRKLSPGTCIRIQFGFQNPVNAIFQEVSFDGCTLIVSNLDDFDDCAAFTYIAVDQINAISVVASCPRRCRDID
ncbi:hypothetical protein [Bacillus cereus group sp. IBL03679]|uniref:hypothetical protein n=2 Tax=Bacillus cereus group sp. IBL03679 TaxID=3240095 RepID=UPI003D2F716C